MKDYSGKSIAANYFRGLEAVGGKITFEETSLLFKSHAFNVQTGETRIAYSQISSVKPRNTCGIIPNGMSVLTKDGQEHRFIIYHRNAVIEFLTSKLA